MKRTARGWVCLALVLGVLPSLGMAAVFFDESLEATPLGAVDNSTATHNGGSWAVTGPADNTTVQVVNDPTGTGMGRVLECQARNTAAMGVYAALGSPRGDNVTWTFDFYNPTTSPQYMTPKCWFANLLSSLLGQFWYTNGQVLNYSYSYPATYDYIASAGTLPLGVWYHAVFTFRQATAYNTYGLFDETITRKSDGAVILNLTNLPQHVPGDPNNPDLRFARFGFNSSNISWTHFYLDNIRLSNPVTADPSISPGGGAAPSAQTITLSCLTSGATIRYTTNGTDPAADNSSGTIYSGPFVLNASATVKARAFATGLDPSWVVNATYTIGQVLFSENLEATPLGAISNATATHNGGSWVVTTPASSSAQVIADPTGAGNGRVLECSDTSGGGTFGVYAAPASPRNDDVTWSFDFYNVNVPQAMQMWPKCWYANGISSILGQIWYTDGSLLNYSWLADPTNGYQMIAPAGTLPSGTWYHMVMAIRRPTAAYTYPYFNMTVTRKSDGAAVLSLTDVPGQNMIAGLTDPNYYFARFGFTSPGWTHFYLDNIHLASSPVTGDPAFSPAGGAYPSDQTVTLSCATAGASIRYTTDGSDPSDNGTGILYTAPIAVHRTTTIKARAFVAGMYPSGIISTSYTIGQLLFDENLEATPLGAIDNNTATHNGGSWMVIPPDNGTVQVINDPTGGGNGRVLECFDGASNSIQVYAAPSSPRNDNVTWTFDFYNPTFPNTLHMNPKCWLANGTSALMWEYWYADGQVLNYSWSYSSPEYRFIAPAATLSAGTWYHMVAAFRQPAVTNDFARYDIKITRKSDGAVVADNVSLPGCNTIALGNPSYYFARFGFVPPQFTGSSSHFYLDNIHLTPSPATGDPVISPNGGAFDTVPQTVTISGPAGASIRYTTDGTDPVDNGTGTLYSGPFTISQSAIVRARAFAAGMYPSGTVSVTFALVAHTPTFSPGTGNYSAGKSVTISSPGSTAIYYTTNGSTPTTGSTLYTGPVSVNGRTTLKAMAVAPSLGNSDVGTAEYYFPSIYNRPVAIPEGSPAVDGDLSDWPAFPGPGWTPIDKPYYPDNTTWPADIPHDGVSCYYAAQWDPTAIYLAVRVRDTAHVFNGNYTGWDTHDALEIHLHTTGWSLSPIGYDATDTDAQHYTIGFNSGGASLWKVISSTAAIPPAWVNFQAVGTVDGQWLEYEVAMKPFQHLDLNSQAASVASPLALGDVIGLDPVVSAESGTAFGMVAENQIKWKSADFTTFGLHVLAPSAYTAADLAAMLATMDARLGDSNWNGLMDLDGDGEVTSTDLSIMLANMQ